MSAVPNSEISIRACPACGKQYRGADEQNERCSTDGSTTILVHLDRALNQVVNDKYLIVSLLGVGAWSEVYKAVDKQTGTFYAVKILHSHLAADPLNVARFNREADVLLQLKHRCFATIYERGVIEGKRPCLVMEYLLGLSLDNYLSSVGRLTLNQALELFEPICDALATAHDKGLLHRDLKPGNIFLVEKDGVLVPKILDFGLAKMFLLGSGGAMASLTQSGEILGTPSYMSPEQCQGNILDQRSDLYALGCMIYEVLTNQKAVPGKSAFEAMSNQIGRIPDPMNQACPEARIPEEAEALIFQLLSKDPADRFDNAREFATQFRSAIEFAKRQPAGAAISSNTNLSVRSAPLLEPGSKGGGSDFNHAGSSGASNSTAGSSSTLTLKDQPAGSSSSGRSGAQISSSGISTNTSNSYTSSVSGRNLKLTAAAVQSMQANKPSSFWKQLSNPVTITLIGVGLAAAGGLIWLLSGMIDTATTAPPMVKEADNLADVRQIANSSTVHLTANNDRALLQAINNQPDIKQLDLSRKRYSPQGLKNLALARSLQQLRMRECTDVDDAALAVIQHSDIFSLDLSGTKVTCAGLQYLKAMPKLRSLDLSSTEITDVGCAVLASMPLDSLNLSSTAITGEGLANLAESKTLRQLFLDDTKIGDSIKAVNPLPLIWLSVKHTDFGDKQLASLTLPKLEQITLDDTKISDAGLLTMPDRKLLKTVWVRDCPGITAPGVAQMQALLAKRGVQMMVFTSGLGANQAADRAKRTKDVMESL